MKTLAKWRARLVNDTNAHDYNKIQLTTVQDVIFVDRVQGILGTIKLGITVSIFWQELRTDYNTTH